LLDFLELFGVKFHFERVSISVLHNGYEDFSLPCQTKLKLPTTRSHTERPIDEGSPGVIKPQPPPLLIVDPLISGHYLGQQTFAMWQVQRTFRVAYTRVLERYRGGFTSDVKLEDVLAEIKT